MLEKKMKSNIFWYLLYKTFHDFGILGPVWMIFCKESLGMSWTTILIIESGCFLLSFLAEFPCGALADLVGRKRMLLWGQIFHFSGMIIASISYNEVTWAITTAIFVLGIPCTSGSDSSFIYDSLKLINRKKEYKQIEGKAFSNQLIVMTIGCFLGSFLMAFSYRACFIMHAIGHLIAIFLILKMKEPPIKSKKIAKNKKIRSIISHMWEVVKVFRKIPCLMYTVFFSVFLLLNFSCVFYTPYFMKINLPTWTYGIIFSTFNIIACITARFAFKLENLLGDKWTLLLMFIGRLLTWLLMCLFHPIWGFVFIYSEQAVRGMNKLIINNIIHKQVSSTHRAASLSFMSSMQMSIKVILLPILGISLDILGFSTVLIGFICILVFGAGTALYKIAQNKCV